MKTARKEEYPQELPTVYLNLLACSPSNLEETELQKFIREEFTESNVTGKALGDVDCFSNTKTEMYINLYVKESNNQPINISALDKCIRLALCFGSHNRLPKVIFGMPKPTERVVQQMIEVLAEKYCWSIYFYPDNVSMMRNK